MKIPLHLAAIFLTGCLGSISSASILFTDTFDSDTGLWYKAATNGMLANTGQQLSWTELGTDVEEVIGRQFAPTSLNVGEILRFSYEFTQTGATPGIIRAGVFNLDNAITADGWAVGAANIGGNFEGYYTFFRDNSAAGNAAREENGLIDTAQTSGPLRLGTTIGTNTTNYDVVQDGSVVYTVVFDVVRTSPTLTNTLFTLSSGSGETETIHFSLAGETSVIHDTFNTVAIRSNGGTALYDSIRVEIIPEPASLAFLGLSLAPLLVRRRR